jgi:hypothetical protein
MDIRSADVHFVYVNRDGQTHRRTYGELCCQVGAECAVGVAGAPEGRIVNGTQAAPGQFPFQVSSYYGPRDRQLGTNLSVRYIRKQQGLCYALS